MKLKINDKIEVKGFIMLKGMNGNLKVSKIDDISYWFTRINGTKVICRHLKSNIDRCINNSSDLNKIEIIN